jgi:hypothetical protein
MYFLLFLILDGTKKDSDLITVVWVSTIFTTKHVLTVMKLELKRSCTVGCKKKTGNENFPNVNLVLATCQLIVYLTIPIK